MKNKQKSAFPLVFFHGIWYNIREKINSRLEGAMYLDFTVKIPDSGKGITRKTIKGSTYIYYTLNP